MKNNMKRNRDDAFYSFMLILSPLDYTKKKKKKENETNNNQIYFKINNIIQKNNTSNSCIFSCCKQCVKIWFRM